MKNDRFLHPIGGGEQSYKIHGITFIVTNRFVPLAGKKLPATLRDRMTHSFKNGFAELPSDEDDGTMPPMGCACSEDRKEDAN